MVCGCEVRWLKEVRVSEPQKAAVNTVNTAPAKNQVEGKLWILDSDLKG